MGDETLHWLRQFVILFLVAGLVHFLMSVSGVLLGWMAASPALVIFGLDSGVGAFREFWCGVRLARRSGPDLPAPRGGAIVLLLGVAYVALGLAAFVAALLRLWRHDASVPSLPGVALAAVSVLVVPIVGSYMKAVAVELKSAALKAAAVFTFGNSYLAMVLLISLLVRTGMERWWGDAAGALVMAPFLLQKGIQILIEGKNSPEGDQSGG